MRPRLDGPNDPGRVPWWLPWLILLTTLSYALFLAEVMTAKAEAPQARKALVVDGKIVPHDGPQSAFLSSTADITIYGGEAGGGKLLKLDTPLATPDGWIEVGHVAIGDRLFDERGYPCRVTALSAVDLEPESFRLTFDDGSEIIACADHQWHTFTNADLGALTKRSPEWRAKRRARRPSRASGKSSARRIQWMAEHNRAIGEAATLGSPLGAVRTTKEIAATLRVRGRVNHAIPVAGRLTLPDVNLPLDPYLLGVWLGDGVSTAGRITTMDEEIPAAFASLGFELGAVSRQAGNRAATFTILGLVTTLRHMGVVGNKQVPAPYLRGSAAQRLALLQGLLDTDGSVRDNGLPEFTNTNERLALAAYELVVSLGWKAHLSEKRAMLYGRDCGPCWTVRFSASESVFRLPRKREKQKLSTRRTSTFRYIVACDPVPPTPMRCLTVDSPSHLFLAGRAMVPTHNTSGLLMEPGRHLGRVKGFNCVIFRRNENDIRKPGGLWDESQLLYGPAGMVPNIVGTEWRNPFLGTKVKFGHLQYLKSLLDYDGAQICLLAFDQLEHFEEEQFWYMMIRNRSTCGVRPYIRATCNPPEYLGEGKRHWLEVFLSWWIDQNPTNPDGTNNPNYGFPIEERSGVVRWFYRQHDKLLWFDSKKEATASAIENGNDAKDAEHLPRSVTFIPASVHDNPTLMELDPGYVASLQNLPYHLRMRFYGGRERRGGNWKVSAGGGTFLNRNWFQLVVAAPPNARLRVRYWDKAGTEGGGKFSAGVLMSKVDEVNAEGRITATRYYVEDVVRGQWSAGRREAIIKATCQQDNLNQYVSTWVELEPGSSGKESAENTITNLAGFAIHADRVTGDKFTRAQPFAAQAEPVGWTPNNPNGGHGNIYLVQGKWNDEYLRELHNANPNSPVDQVLDQMDASSGAFNKLATSGYGFGMA